LLGHGYAIPTQTFTHSLPALQTQRLGKNGFTPLRLLIRAGKPSYTAETLYAICA